MAFPRFYAAFVLVLCFVRVFRNRWSVYQSANTLSKIVLGRIFQESRYRPCLSDVRRVKIGQFDTSANFSGETVKQIVEDDANTSEIAVEEVCLFEERKMEFDQVGSSARASFAELNGT